jgi:hypothetical protein
MYKKYRIFGSLNITLEREKVSSVLEMFLQGNFQYGIKVFEAIFCVLLERPVGCRKHYVFLKLWVRMTISAAPSSRRIESSIPLTFIVFTMHSLLKEDEADK